MKYQKQHNTRIPLENKKFKKVLLDLYLLEGEKSHQYKGNEL